MQRISGPNVGHTQPSNGAVRPVRAESSCGAESRTKRSPGGASSLPQDALRRWAAIAAAIQLSIAPAHAAWDGVSAATGSCPLGEEGTECRKSVLSRDQFTSYSDARTNSAKRGDAATGVPVSDLGLGYAADTVKLGNKILKYATADPYDEERLTLVKEIKLEGPGWVSKYARGGSARTLSARRFYIAVDAVEGHLASNGLAPFPRNKLQKLISDIEESKQLLTDGK